MGGNVPRAVIDGVAVVELDGVIVRVPRQVWVDVEVAVEVLERVKERVAVGVRVGTVVDVLVWVIVIVGVGVKVERGSNRAGNG